MTPALSRCPSQRCGCTNCSQPTERSKRPALNLEGEVQGGSETRLFRLCAALLLADDHVLDVVVLDQELGRAVIEADQTGVVVLR